MYVHKFEPFHAQDWAQKEKLEIETKVLKVLKASRNLRQQCLDANIWSSHFVVTGPAYEHFTTVYRKIFVLPEK